MGRKKAALSILKISLPESTGKEAANALKREQSKIS